MKSRYDFLKRREDRRNLALVRSSGAVALLAVLVGLTAVPHSHPPVVEDPPAAAPADAPQPTPHLAEPGSF